MVSRRMLRLIAAGGLSLATFGQSTPRMAPIPSDPLELVSGQIQPVDTPESRDAILLLLARARDSYSLRNAGSAYDLKVTFTVDSGGQTEYDGTWQMEDVFDPQQGLHWTAKAAGGFTTSRISSKTMFYEDGTASTIPLRLHEARAALFDPIPSSENAARAQIRTSTAVLHGTKLTCVLLSAPGSAATATPGRGWVESEECIDPESGLLQVQSHTRAVLRLRLHERPKAWRLSVASNGDRDRSRQNRLEDLRGQPGGASRRRFRPVCAH